VKQSEEFIQFQVKRIAEGLDYLGKTVVILQEVQRDLENKNTDIFDKVKAALDAIEALKGVAKDFKADVLPPKPTT
jgi:CRISPR/Cas system-associated protein Cas7 (RAMP superfamily)